ncbi:hypothetical protein B0J11DRAFT_551654 [Dendryphion nanum]|uniref:Zn(2)-C6 fungal-type domain-containing protein n=1 Tax=Dendryphion nanum TaxID=256645 RepID=A0A9P9DL42_9PLEO|nr:hypothetical protein B0J11DRAFT_551654 [Dendryphion nanum]
MSGFYNPNHHIPPQYYNVNPNQNHNALPNPNMPHGLPVMLQEHPAPPGIPPQGGPIYHQMPYVQYEDSSFQQHLDQYEDVSGGMGAAQGGNPRARRRTAPGEHVKHRRTRSGCYTCRQRRVKCDEKRPICERCTKGNRECIYPDPQTGSKPAPRGGSKSSHKSGTDGSSPEDLDDDDESQDRLPAIYDEDEEDMDFDSSQLSQDQAREESDTPGLTLDRSPSPATEPFSAISNMSSRPQLSRKDSNQTTKKLSSSSKSHAKLPQDVKFYLNWFRHNMSVHHYSLKRDSGNFLKTDFLEMAIKYEPLRYAVVGYAAYFHTLTKPDGRMSSFLQYYNESVSRLRASITKNKKQGLSTFLTILQLASIEELLGDWVNLMGHQKAAYEILTRLYTPKTICQTELLRKVLLWYVRFDLFVGLQSGGEAMLSRDWYVAVHEYYSQSALEDPSNLTLKYEERFAYSRLVAKDASDLFSRKARGLSSDAEFMTQLPIVSEKMKSLETIDPVLLDAKDYVTDLQGKPDPDDIVDPYEHNVIWKGDRWTSNYLLLDMYGIVLMWHVQISMAMRKPFDPEATKLAWKACQVFEAVCLYQDAPPGAIIEAHATMAIATLFLPKDPQTIQWSRRIFAKVESSGYIYSNTLRNRLLESWGLEHSDWWLPNDESCPRIIRSIKDFIMDRTTKPKDQTSEDLREMRGFFSTLTISDSPLSDTTSTTPTSITLESALGGSVTSSLDGTLVYSGGSPDYDWNYDSKFTAPEAYGSGPGK